MAVTTVLRTCLRPIGLYRRRGWIFLAWMVALFLGGGHLAPAAADDTGLAAIHTMLIPLRSLRGEPSAFNFNGTDARSATPALMPVKHALRDWVESRLTALGQDGDAAALAAHLTEELAQADLFCASPKDPSKDRCASEQYDWNAIGFLNSIHIDRPDSGGVVVLRTSVGIECGFDDSAYAYEWRDGKWERFWQDEQDIQEGKSYTPQTIYPVAISAPDQKAYQRLILSLGRVSWCQSNYYPVYFRLWRSAPGMAPRLLLNGSQQAYVANDPPIIGDVTGSEAAIVYTVPSIDPGSAYDIVRRYRVAGNGVERIDPVASDPRGFVDEWLQADWSESSGWSEGNSGRLKSWRERLHKGPTVPGGFNGEFDEKTTACRKAPDLRQVPVDFAGWVRGMGTVYFFVRWRPPYSFRMVEISTKPRPDCNLEDDGRAVVPLPDWK